MAEQDEELQKELEQCIDSIYSALIEARYNLYIWLELFPVEAKVQILNAYKGFFIPTIIAHKNSLYVNLYKVLDKRSDSYHFNCLFDLLGKGSSIESDIIDNYRERMYKEHAEVIKRIKRYRHKSIAHIDKEFIALKRKPETKIDPEIKVTIGEAKALLKTLESIINDISVKILRKHRSYRLDRANDPARTIIDLGAAIKS